MTDDVAKKLLELISMVALLVVSFLLSGFTICMLWKWFVVTHFGFQPLPYVTALGLGIFSGYLTFSPARSKMSEDYKWTFFFQAGLWKHLIALGFGWLIHLFL
jgi:hypothetical protein